MRSWALAGAGLLACLAAGAYVDHLFFATKAQDTAIVIEPHKAALRPSPIRTEWITEGHPTTEAALIAKTDDGSTKVFVWQTTKSQFDWTYDFDEVVQIVGGEVFLTDKSMVERRAGVGDVVFFPAGAKVHWRVPDHVRKIATVKNILPKPIAGLMRWVRTAKQWIKPTNAFAD